jgi:hypothetical protein
MVEKQRFSTSVTLLPIPLPVGVYILLLILLALNPETGRRTSLYLASGIYLSLRNVYRSLFSVNWGRWYQVLDIRYIND